MADTLTVTTEQLENREVRLTVEIPDSVATPVLRKAARRIAGEVRVPGFRPGKAPYEVIVRRFGRETLVQEALEDLVETVYADALTQSEIQAGGMPSLDQFTAEPLSLTFRVPQRPLVELGDYRELRVPYTEATVSPEDVDALIDNLRQEHTTWVPVERPAQFGDLVTVDLHGEVDGETTIEQENWDLELSETGEALIPGLDTAFIGLAAGDQKSFTLTYPEDSTSQWAGKVANFTTTMHTVKAELAPSDDALAAEAGEFDNMEALRSHLQANLYEERKDQAENLYRQTVADAFVAAATTVEYPPSLLENELNLIENEQEAYYGEMGIDMESFLRYTNQTREGLRAQLRPMAERRLRQRLVVTELARAEGVHLHEEDLEAEIERLTETTSGANADAYREMLHTPGGQLYLMETLTNRLAIDRMVAIAKGEPLAPLHHDDTAENDLMAETMAAALTEPADAAPGETAASDDE